MRGPLVDSLMPTLFRNKANLVSCWMIYHYIIYHYSIPWLDRVIKCYKHSELWSNVQQMTQVQNLTPKEKLLTNPLWIPISIHFYCWRLPPSLDVVCVFVSKRFSRPHQPTHIGLSSLNPHFLLLKTAFPLVKSMYGTHGEPRISHQSLGDCN